MNKLEVYKRCMTCQKDLSEMFEDNWYNDLRKYIDGSLGISTHYIDAKTHEDVLHLAVPDRDIGLLCLTMNRKEDECVGLKDCVLPDVLFELYSTVRKQYELRKTEKSIVLYEEKRI